MMHTTAGDMARFMLALMNNGQYGESRLLQPETIEHMQQRTTGFKVLFKSSDDLPQEGHGLGLFAFRCGWFGSGGSAPGFQCLLRFHPSRQAGYVILSNVNAILGGGVIGVLVLWFLVLRLWVRRRKSQRRNAEVTTTT